LAEIEDITESVHELRAPYRAAVLIRHELIPNKPKKPAQQIYDDALDLLVDAFRRRRVPLLE
jgi:hypothetical protein